MSKQWFKVIIVIVGIYEIIIGLLFLVATPVLTSMLGLVPDAYSTSLGQHFGGALIPFGLLEVVSARDLERWLAIPILAALGRIFSFGVMLFYVATLVLPLLTMLPFIIIDGVSAFLVLFVVFVSKEYNYRHAFGL
jgi:hypothetical protein